MALVDQIVKLIVADMKSSENGQNSGFNKIAFKVRSVIAGRSSSSAEKPEGFVALRNPRLPAQTEVPCWPNKPNEP
jgi:hypothetical protein